MVLADIAELVDGEQVLVRYASSALEVTCRVQRKEMVCKFIIEKVTMNFHDLTSYHKGATLFTNSYPGCVVYRLLDVWGDPWF